MSAYVKDPATPQEAIEFIRECRRTHVEWAAWLEANPEGARDPAPTVEVAGDAIHHRRCVAGYDLVLGLLGASGNPEGAG